MKKRFYQKLFCLILTLVLFVLFFSCQNYRKENIIKEKKILFDSFFEISIISDNTEKTKKDIEDLFSKIEDLGNKFDWRNSKSLLSNSDQKNDLIIPDEFKDFFSKIKYFNEFTEGYFNPFLRKLVIAYNNFEQGTTPPDDENIKLILQKIGKSKIYFDDKSNIIVKYPENLDLGAAIAGFLVDYSYKILIEKGYKNFLVNGSGEIRVSGSKFGKNWLIGIQDPFSNSIIDAIKMPDGYSISTSGSYERFFIYKGQKFHHILNPYSGKPDSKLESVSIVSKNSCLESDILSTAVFAMGIDRAIKFCEKNNVDYYLIYKEDEKIVIKHSKFFDK